MKAPTPCKPTLADAQAKLKQADRLLNEATRFREEANDLFRQCYGLKPGVTRVRQGDLEGIFLEVIRFKRSEGRLWIRVELDPPLPERWGRFRNFYGAWEKVSDP